MERGTLGWFDILARALIPAPGSVAMGVLGGRDANLRLLFLQRRGEGGDEPAHDHEEAQ
jgi:hypothetical protein